MNKGLEAFNDAKENLKEIDNHVGFDYKFEISEIKDDFDILEKELIEGEEAKELLKIIIEKRVQVMSIRWFKDVEEYNDNILIPSIQKLTETEFNKIKGKLIV